MKADPIHYLSKGRSIFAESARLRWTALKPRDEVCPKLPHMGSDKSVFQSIQLLYAHSLVAAEMTDAVRDTVEWLMETEYPPFQMQSDVVTYDNLFFRTWGNDRRMMRNMGATVFTPGCSGFVKTGASLYFAVHFGMDKHKRAIAAFDKVQEISEKRKGRFCSGSCGNNMIQALAVHPELRESHATKTACEFLYSNQTKTGNWGKGIPLYQTFSALSRIENDIACDMFESAYGYLDSRQNVDGSWGRKDSEFRTYLVVDALIRKGKLKAENANKSFNHDLCRPASKLNV